MTLPTYVFRRGNLFSVRLRVPSDLLSILKRRELWRALRTSCPETARLRGAFAVALARELFALVRENPSMTEDRVKALLRDFYDKELEHDRLRRLDKVSEFRSMMEARVKKQALCEAIEEVNRGDFQWIAGEADKLMGQLGVAHPPESQAYRELCQNLLRIRAEVIRRSIERDQGDWAGMPNDPLIVSLLPEAVTPPALASATVLPNALALSPRSAQSVAVLIEDFLVEKGGIGKSALGKYRVVAKLFDELIGGKSAGTVGRQDVVDFKDMLLRLPTNWTKRKEFKGKTPKEAGTINASLSNPHPTLSAGTINDGYLTFLNTFFRWALVNNIVTTNPAQSVLVTTPKGYARKRKRDPFTIGQLQVIFRAPVFSGCAGRGTGMYEAGSVLIRDHHFWVPLVALFSGARLNELGQLEVTDVLERSGVSILKITTLSDGDDPEDEKSIKTEAGERIVPIHPELIRLGFLDYIEERRTAGDRRVFPRWDKGADRTYSSVFSKFFNARLLTKLGIKTPRLVFHSLRHNFMDAMRDAEIDDSIKKVLIGHADSSVSAKYGKGAGVNALARAMARVKYESLDLSHLMRAAR